VHWPKECGDYVFEINRHKDKKPSSMGCFSLAPRLPLIFSNHFLGQCSQFNVHMNHLDVLLNACSEGGGLGWSPRLCISNKLTGDDGLAAYT
jgi:hypothetical protein